MFNPTSISFQLKLSRTKSVFYPYSNLLYIEACGKACIVYLLINNELKEIPLSKTLGEMEKELKHPSIVRVHNSYIVNLDYKYSYDSSVRVLELLTGNKIPVSKTLKPWFGFFIGD